MGLIAIPKRSRLLVSLRPCPGQANITQTVSTNVWMLTCLRLLFYSQMGRMTLRNASWWNWPLSTERTATLPNQPPPRLVAVSRPPLVSPAPLGQRPLAIHASSVCAVLIALRFFFSPFLSLGCLCLILHYGVFFLWLKDIISSTPWRRPLPMEWGTCSCSSHCMIEAFYNHPVTIYLSFVYYYNTAEKKILCTHIDTVNLTKIMMEKNDAGYANLAVI